MTFSINCKREIKHGRKNGMSEHFCECGVGTVYPWVPCGDLARFKIHDAAEDKDVWLCAKHYDECGEAWERGDLL